MKMISNTNRTSISGVTLMKGTAVFRVRFSCISGSIADCIYLILLFFCSALGSWLGGLAALLLISNKANLVDAEFSHLVDDVNNVSITHANTALDINDSILFVLDRL